MHRKNFPAVLAACVVFAVTVALLCGWLVTRPSGLRSPVAAVRAAALSERLVGKWRNKRDAGSTVEFFDDGTMMDRESGREGRWTVVGEDRIRLSASVLGTDAASLVEGIRFSGDCMLFSVNGREGEASRMP